MKSFFVFLFSVAAILVLVFGQFHYNQSIQHSAKAAKLSLTNEKSSWKGCNWYAIGDSITYADKYQPLVQKGLGLNVVVTDAIPGETIRTMTNHITAQKLKNIDLITVFGGTNDYASKRILGTIRDDKTKNTFYGHLKYNIEKILANKSKNAKVVFFTPLKRGTYKKQVVYPKPNAAGFRLEDYVEAEKKVCKLYAIPVIDLFHESGIEKKNLKRYTIDNLHPNDAGHKLIANVIIRELKMLKAKS